MPRKRNPDSKPTPAQKREALHKAITDGYQGDDIVSKLFQKAVELDGQKREVYAEQAKNRRSLRDLAGQGLASQEDVDALYPPKSTTNGEAEAEAEVAA